MKLDVKEGNIEFRILFLWKQEITGNTKIFYHKFFLSTMYLYGFSESSFLL